MVVVCVCHSDDESFSSWALLKLTFGSRPVSIKMATTISKQHTTGESTQWHARGW